MTEAPVRCIQTEVVWQWIGMVSVATIMLALVITIFVALYQLLR